MLKKMGIGLCILLGILALSNPEENSLKVKVEEKSYDNKTTVFSNTKVGKIDNTNFLVCSIANVNMMYNVGAMGATIHSSYDEVKYIGILGNWFKFNT